MTYWDYFLHVLNSIFHFILDIPMYIIGAIIATIMSIANGGHP